MTAPHRRVAIDPTKGAADIATPGHVFPLRARDGGVLVRAGHTEAAVDVSRLAGLNPSGVICEIMNEDGTMARLPDLVAFAQKHGLKIGTISDLIAYRRRHDNLIAERAQRAVHSVHGGDWMMRVFADETQGAEHIVLTKGDLTAPGPVMVRMHALDPLHDVLGIDRARAGDLPAAMRLIAAEGRGVVVLFRDLEDHPLRCRARSFAACAAPIRAWRADPVDAGPVGTDLADQFGAGEGGRA
jgi:3,4-dihydroxy 2-butanone 4-phosphate synthase/GTP cyclohydrolase II